MQIEMVQLKVHVDHVLLQVTAISAKRNLAPKMHQDE